ncbi:hypothetical protein IG631_01790 [Alternaria alternata]|nr:hypothetical protein IG631_01790 [Alternaria alternata]
MRTFFAPERLSKEVRKMLSRNRADAFCGQGRLEQCASNPPVLHSSEADLLL